MPSDPDDHSNGSRMEWADIQANIDNAREWVNDIPPEDTADSAIRREHLVRPVILGFPSRGMFSTLQQAQYADLGPNASPGQPFNNEALGAAKDRLTIIPGISDGSTGVWRTPLARTLRLHRTSDVEVHASFWAIVVADGTLVLHPDGAGAGDVAGYFALHGFRRGAAAATVSNRGRQDVYYSANRVHLTMVDTFPAGVLELSVVYHHNGASSDIQQIDLTRATFSVEVF